MRGAQLAAAVIPGRRSWHVDLTTADSRAREVTLLPAERPNRLCLTRRYSILYGIQQSRVWALWPRPYPSPNARFSPDGVTTEKGRVP